MRDRQKALGPTVMTVDSYAVHLKYSLSLPKIISKCGNMSY